MIDTIRTAFDQTTAQSGSAATWIRPYTDDAGPSDHQFVLFLKPEVTDVANGLDLNAILGIVLEELDRWNVNIGAVRALNGDYLAEKRIMHAHYGVINQISTQGYDAISEGAQAKLTSIYEKDLQRGATVLGAHQFLEAEPDFTAVALTSINDSFGTEKLGGGTYALKLEVLSKPYIILNPFHPYQLVPYTTSGHGIIAIEGRSKTPWADLRSKLTGATNPTHAEEGSIRNRLMVNADAIGLKSVGPGTNGVHLSAGALEGMVELTRFFSDDAKPVTFADTSFGRLLAQGPAAAAIDQLAENTLLKIGGENVSTFDLTEELDAAEAAKKLEAGLAG
jgi:hypothetical protein